LASFITDYHWENGRRYHAFSDGAYWGPNDENSQDSQDLAHHLYTLTLGNKLHLAPLGNPHNILDLGTGTGIWAIEMAEKYPSAHVIGTDLSPIQPNFVPPNCDFEIEDVTREWTYPQNKFDFIHIRELFGSVPDWTFLFAEVYKATKPGGWVEICEHAVTPITEHPDPNPDPKSTEAFYNLWGRTVIGMGEIFGKTFEIWKESKSYLEAAGFVDVVEHRFKWPMNGWPQDEKSRELGLWNQLRLYDGVEGFMLRLLTNVGGFSYERAQLFLAEMRRALKDPTCHAFLDVSVVYGRKPGGA